MKKVFSSMLAMLMLCNVNCVSAEKTEKIQAKIYDECVMISGYLPYAAVGDEVLITVLNRDIDIDTFDKYEELEDIIVYQGESTVDEKNGYEFLFKTDSGGKHYVYLASKAYEDVITVEYSYVSKSVYDNMPTSGKNDLYSYLKENKKLIGLDEDFYTDEVISDIAELLIASKEDLELNKDTLTEMTEKGFIVAGLNSGKLQDIKGYEDMLGVLKESDIKYFPTDDTEDFTELLREKNFKTIKEFDEALSEAIVLFAINNSSASKIKAVISDNKEIFGDITVSSDLAEYLKEEAPYNDVEEIKDEISDYKPDKNTSSGGGGGGNGGGGGKNNASLPMMTPGNVVSGSDAKQEFSPFDDIAGVAWAKEAITGLYHKGIINGKEERKFYPFDNITRNEFAKIVTVAFDLNLIDDYFPFSDITESHWAYPYVKTAYLAGITNGYSEDYFGGDEFITRQDLCVMVYRAFKACDVEIVENTDKVLSDENAISDYAKDAVKAMVRCGIISGDENSRFNPKNNATRAEAAKILYVATSMIK